VGPLALYFTLMEIAFCDTKTIDWLSAALAKIKLALFNNESTAEHASVWQKMLTFLQVYNKVLVNAITLLLEQYSKCSVPGFCQTLCYAHLSQTSCLDSVSSILKEGQDRTLS